MNKNNIHPFQINRFDNSKYGQGELKTVKKGFKNLMNEGDI